MLIKSEPQSHRDTVSLNYTGNCSVSSLSPWMSPTWLCRRLLQSYVWSCVLDRLWTHMIALSSALSQTAFHFAPDRTPKCTLNLTKCSAASGAARVWLCHSILNLVSFFFFFLILLIYTLASRHHQLLLFAGTWQKNQIKKIILLAERLCSNFQKTNLLLIHKILQCLKSKDFQLFSKKDKFSCILAVILQAFFLL